MQQKIISALVTVYAIVALCLLFTGTSDTVPRIVIGGVIILVWAITMLCLDYIYN